jgi:hypothetical protein
VPNIIMSDLSSSVQSTYDVFTDLKVPANIDSTKHKTLLGLETTSVGTFYLSPAAAQFA